MGSNNNAENLSAQDKVTREWDAMAGEWDDLAAGYAAGFYKRLQQLWDHATIIAGRGGGLMDASTAAAAAAVVDFGCGTGLLTEKLRTHCRKVLAVDASNRMMSVVKEKIRNFEWDNVQAVTAVLGQLDSMTDDVRQVIADWEGTADLVVASSVMSFIPEADMEATMKSISSLLKPGGVFCHSDWPISEAKHPDAMTEVKAMTMYSMGGLIAESMKIVTLDVGRGGESVDVFIGVARKD